MARSARSSFTCPVVIGRERELALVHEWLAAGDGGAVLVGGDAGIGKTRLVREAVAGARRLGYAVVQTGCFEPDRTVPYAPLCDLLVATAERHPVADLARWAGPYAAELCRLLPDLAPMVSTVDGAADGEPTQQRRRLFEAAARVVHGVAGEAPPLLVVEDVHWSDEGSLAFLLFLVRRAATPRPTLLLTYRPDDVEPALAHLLAEFDRERCATELTLPGLGPSDVAHMLRTILDLPRPVPADALHLVWTLTEGNPFFVEELLKTLHATSTDAGLAPDLTSVDKLRVPRSVQDAVGRRTACLDPETRRILDLAAVAGRRFDFALLRHLAQTDDVDLLAAMKTLVAAQLVVEEAADSFAFRHALTRQAIYARLLTRERQLLHGAVAAAIAHVHADRLDDYVGELAEHFAEAGGWEQALDYSRRACERAATLDAPAVAVHHFSRALAAAGHLIGVPTADLAHARGRAYETLGDFDRALADYETARDRARAAADQMAEVEALLSLGLLWSSRDYARTGDCVREAVTIARALGDRRLLARSLNRLGNWHLNVEQPQVAQRYHREALAVVEALADRRGMAETLDLLGMASYLGGDLVGGTVHYERAVDLWRALGDRRGLASTLGYMTACGPSFHGATVVAAATLAEARRAGDEALATSRAIGWRAGEAWTLASLGGLCLAAQGAYAEAFAATREGLAIAEAIEHRQWTVGGHCLLGECYADVLALPRARHHLELARGMACEIGSTYWERSATGWLASVVVAQGELATAEALLASALGDETPIDTLAGRLLWSARAELALAQGDPLYALDLTDRLVRSAPHAADERPIAWLAKLRGEALTALGRLTEAEHALGLARATAAALGARPLLWRIDLARGRLYIGQERQPEAERAFAAVRALIEDLAAGLPDDGLRAEFVTGAARLVPIARTRRARPAADGAVGMGKLTAREREVAALLTRGLSNRELADALFVAEWTAATHVRNILAKLEFTSRTQIAAWAVEHGLAADGSPPGPARRPST